MDSNTNSAISMEASMEIPIKSSLTPIVSKKLQLDSMPQPPTCNFDIDQEVDEDEISQHMTTSYSEISFKSDGASPEFEISLSLPLESISSQMKLCERAPKTLGPLDLEGSVHVENNMTHFVAEDLEYKIKLSNLQRTKEIGQVDIGLLNDVEFEAQRIATSIDNLTENLCGILHSMSSITADNIDVYRSAVFKMSDAMDTNIKSMYTIMAKSEEITQAMKAVEVYSIRLKGIKKLVDLLETYV